MAKVEHNNQENNDAKSRTTDSSVGARVKIYTTATCGFCRAEKAYLSGKGVKFEEVRVDTDINAAQEMVGLSGQLGVPFTVIETEDGKKEGILGFDQARLSQALGI